MKFFFYIFQKPPNYLGTRTSVI